MSSIFRPRDPKGALLLTHATVACAWSALLALYDAWLCAQRTSAPVSLTVLTVFTTFAFGTILFTVWPLALIRGVLRAWAESRVLRRLAVGLVEGVLLAYLFFIRVRYATITSKQMWIAGSLLVAGAALAFVLAPRFPRLTRLGNVGLLGCALALQAWLPFRENVALHLAVDLVAAAGFAGLVLPWVERISGVTQQVTCALALGLVLLSPHTFRTSMPTRGLLYDVSSHASAHLNAWYPVFRVKPEGRERLGEQLCSAKADHLCAGSVANRPTQLAGAAKGADVLMLSIDALRWDRVSALRELTKELGPHVRFTRAVSPASRTLHSFGAMLRGRMLRQLEFDPTVKHQGLAESAPPTLGAIFRDHGYRSLNAVTHVFFGAGAGITRGFELLHVNQAEPGTLMYGGSRGPFEHAAHTLLAAARETQTPLLAWVHAMETHDPYVSTQGLDSTSEGQLRALHDIDKKLAQFVRDFRATRAGRELVIIVFGDHGEEFGEHGGRYHSSTVYAELSRVALLIAAPHVTPRAIDAPVSTAALPATLFELTGIERPCSFTLPSLLACIERADACPTLAVSELVPFGSSRKRLIGYTSRTHRLIHEGRHDVVRLFDTERDPYERKDLVYSDAAALASMRRQARIWDRDYCIARD